MKKIIITMCMLTVACVVNAQKLKEADVPSAVKTKFYALYPSIAKVMWEKEDGKFEAEFHQNKVETSVLFDAAGILQQTETEIPVSGLPTAVKEYVSQNLKDSKIKEAAKIVDVYGAVTYEAEINNLDYIFDAEGKFIDSEDGDSE